MHGMHVLLEMAANAPNLFVPRQVRHLLNTVPGALVPCQPFRVLHFTTSAKPLPKFQPRRRQSGPRDVTTTLVFASPPSPSWKLVFLHSANRRVHRTLRRS